MRYADVAAQICGTRECCTSSPYYYTTGYFTRLKVIYTIVSEVWRNQVLVRFPGNLPFTFTWVELPRW